jgi:thioredoxin-dependent peroxiredoxin
VSINYKQKTRNAMSLRLNSTAPDSTASTTKGTVNFHEWIDEGWAMLFSHPKDFTPVCTTELGYMVKIEPALLNAIAKLSAKVFTL